MLFDPFALMGKPRRPWLDQADLKETFHRLSAQAHADRLGETGPSADLNAAYAVLRDPAQRLRSLLELEHPEALNRTAEVPRHLGDLFMRLATLRRAVGAFVDQRSQASSPLAQALLASESFALKRDVTKELALLEEARTEGEEQVKLADESWHAADEALVAQVALLQQELAYLAKWNWQLREALFQLETN